MKEYEGMFLVEAGRGGHDAPRLLEEIRGILEKQGAEIESGDKWDDRRLAYEIRGRRRGTYLLFEFKAEPSAIAGIRRQCRLADKILRALITLRGPKRPVPETPEGAEAPAAEGAAAEAPKSDKAPAAEAAAAQEAAATAGEAKEAEGA